MNEAGVCLVSSLVDSRRCIWNSGVSNVLLLDSPIFKILSPLLPIFLTTNWIASAWAGCKLDVKWNISCWMCGCRLWWKSIVSSSWNHLQHGRSIWDSGVSHFFLMITIVFKILSPGLMFFFSSYWIACHWSFSSLNVKWNLSCCSSGCWLWWKCWVSSSWNHWFQSLKIDVWNWSHTKPFNNFIKLKSWSIRDSCISYHLLLNAIIFEVLSPSLPFFFSSYWIASAWDFSRLYMKWLH